MDMDVAPVFPNQSDKAAKNRTPSATQVFENRVHIIPPCNRGGNNTHTHSFNVATTNCYYCRTSPTVACPLSRSPSFLLPS